MKLVPPARRISAVAEKRLSVSDGPGDTGEELGRGLGDMALRVASQVTGFKHAQGVGGQLRATRANGSFLVA
jgi:hypothetical protein